MSAQISNIRPKPDQVLVDIADYAAGAAIDSREAYATAHYCLLDTLGCGFEALAYPACTKLLGPIVPGTAVPHGAKVPGTAYQLDPVQAAFNLGAMIRWLDFNDTWLAAEWGHPSDNLGGILMCADWLSRSAIAAGRRPLVDARRADGHDQGPRNPGRDRAGQQLQPRRARPCRAGQGRFDRSDRGDARAIARRDRQRGVTCLRRRTEPAHLPPRAEYRIAQKLGSGRRDLARSASRADREDRRDGLSVGADREDAGASTMCCSGASRSGSIAPTAAT